MMNKHGNEMNMNMRYGMQSHQQQSHPQMMQQQMQHRQVPPNQIPPNHYHPNPQNTGPGPWWNPPNRYGHSMPGIHHKDGIKPNDSG